MEPPYLAGVWSLLVARWRGQCGVASIRVGGSLHHSEGGTVTVTVRWSLRIHSDRSGNGPIDRVSLFTTRTVVTARECAALPREIGARREDDEDDIVFGGGGASGTDGGEGGGGAAASAKDDDDDGDGVATERPAATMRAAWPPQCGRIAMRIYYLDQVLVRSSRFIEKLTKVCSVVPYVNHCSLFAINLHTSYGSGTNAND